MLLAGDLNEALVVYRDLYARNLDADSLKTSYRHALLASRLDTAQVDNLLREERSRFADAIALRLEGGQPGKLAPSFILTDLDGYSIALQAFRGRVVVLNFWASWCSPCLAEIPILNELHMDFSAHSV
ncbi:MAG: hypothetical protein CME19_24610 [Gemmatimonadetes bacterium]|nr:hypothetical protein [Gemmatimonadota bacterium]